MKVKLTRQDIHKAECLGRDTVEICRMRGIKPRLINKKQSRDDANVMGFLAEIAVARLYELDQPVLNITNDGGLDLWIGDPLRTMYSLDAKWTSTKELIFDSMASFEADFAVGVTSLTEDVMEIHGFVSRRKFEKCSVTKDYKYGPRLVMPLSDLAPPEQLWRLVMSEKFKAEEEA
jgi:hypothetical protein